MTVPAAAPGVLTGYDSARPGLIPATAQVIFPYADGDYAWAKADLDRFPHARRRMITVLGSARIAMICDVEKGDVPADAMAAAHKAATARSFVQARASMGRLAVIYCNRSTLAAVQAACAGLEYRVWLSTLDGSRPRYYGGASILAIQYQDTGEYDESEVYETDWLRAA